MIHMLYIENVFIKVMLVLRLRIRLTRKSVYIFEDINSLNTLVKRYSEILLVNKYGKIHEVILIPILCVLGLYSIFVGLIH